jgi:PilZ domain-containing protein
VGHAYVQQTRPVRLPFAAELRATDLNSGSEIWGETTNLSKGGCYVRTGQLFPEGTLLLIEIRNHGVRFVTDARVAYALEREGMGLSFLNIPAKQLPILGDWLSSAVGEQSVQAQPRAAE